MATINPFYRFEAPPANAGFYPECNRVSQLLTDFYNAFNSIIYEFQTVNWVYAHKSLKELVATFNEAPYFADFVIEYPIPFPNLSGVDYLEIKIYNKQLKAVHLGQFLTIGVDYNNSVVYCYMLTFIPVLSIAANLNPPFVREEQKAITGLRIVESNGAAFFEKPYFWDNANQTAKTPLARGKSWKNNLDYGYQTRTSSTIPASPIYRPLLKPISADAESVFSVMNQILKAGYDGMTFGELVVFFYGLQISNQFPDGWTSLYGNNILEDVVEFTFHNGVEIVKVIGYNSGSAWSFQRFYGYGVYDGITIWEVITITQLPIDPNIAVMYLGIYYDFDIADFEPACIEPIETYPMPIKPADNLLFIIPQGLANINNIDSVSVGLFTEEGLFVQKVGDATLDVETLVCTKFVLDVEALSIFIGLYPVGLAVYESPNVIPDYSFTPTATIPYIGTPTEYLDLMVAEFLDGTITYVDLGGDNYQITWTINQEFVAPKQGVVGWATGFGDNWDLESLPSSNPINCSVAVCQNYVLANVLIPSRPTGCYRFGLYSINEETPEYNLYSLSNLLSLDSSDCFSTIIEFYGEDNSVAQGFFYGANWRQRIRLGINGGGQQPKIEENIYRQSNGVFKRPQNKQDLSVDLHTDFIDFPTQCALVDATRHPYLIWNNKNLFVNGDIEVATTQDFTTQSSFESLAQVKFSALVQGYQPKNSTCINC
jgi:hypothetical protein